MTILVAALAVLAVLEAVVVVLACRARRRADQLRRLHREVAALLRVVIYRAWYATTSDADSGVALKRTVRCLGGPCGPVNATKEDLGV